MTLALFSKCVVSYQSTGKYIYSPFLINLQLSTHLKQHYNIHFPLSNRLKETLTAQIHPHSSPSTQPLSPTTILNPTLPRPFFLTKMYDASPIQNQASSTTNAATTLSSWPLHGTWLVPVAWALAFYCVLSMLLLCLMYARGLIDGKLNVSYSFQSYLFLCFRLKRLLMQRYSLSRAVVR